MMLFKERKELADKAERWMEENHVAITPLSVISFLEAMNYLNDTPSAQPTLYGYSIDHLAFIASIMAKENITPEKVIEVMSDASYIATFVEEEIKRIIESEVERWRR